MVVVLLAAGVLLGSFLLEWRGPRLGSPGSERTVEGLPSTLPEQALEDRLSVEVLNGAGDPGAAARVTDRLREMGFDVKTYGNAPSFGHEVTIVIDRSGRPGAARAVADSLRVTRLESDPRPELYLDATVVLGQDWRRLLASPEPDP